MHWKAPFRENASPTLLCGAYCAVTLVTPDKAQRIAVNIAQAAGVAASKVIHMPVPMTAFGGKADITRTCADVRF